MLYCLDVDGTLIEGFLEEATCEACGGEGRVLTERSIAEELRAAPGLSEEGAAALAKGYADMADSNPGNRCEACRGKGKTFGGHLPYERVQPLPGRAETIRRLAGAGHSFAIATNQGGVAMGYQTRDEVLLKMGAVAAAFEHFYGATFSVHIAFHHPHAKVPEYLAPEGYDLRKPAGGMIRQAVEARYGFGPDVPRAEGMAVYVGDLATDRDAAEDAGVRFQWAEEFFGDG